MSEIINNAIQSTKDRLDIDRKLSDDLVFGIVCFKYFYNDGKFDITDFNGSYTDGPNDGGIDLIAVNENDISKSLVLIQSKNVQDFNSKDDIKDIFIKMAQTVSDFHNEKIGSYNDKLRRIYREKFDDTSDDYNFSIELVLFLCFDKEDRYKEKIDDHLSKIEVLEDFEISIFYKNEIEQQIESFEEGQRFVDYGVVSFYKDHGIIKNDENGILVDVSAISIRTLYDKYKDHGLFEQNFRYFIKNKKIDDQIRESLKRKRDKFWFLNNGIIIGCKDFWIDGHNVKLEDFSIINGCQTTTILGSYKESNQSLDFPISCKIVKPDKVGEDYFNLFISEIAEASNSQKPISDRDLKSNQPEQRKLQQELKREDPKIYLEIKRGEGILRRRNLENWQKVKNDTLGQLILSIILQQPGTARSNKKKIFSDKSIYNRIFKRTHNKETIVDILKLAGFYDKYVSQETSLNETATNVAKNGKYSILAIVGLLLKHRRHLINLNLGTNSSDWISDINSDNLNGKLFDPNRPDDFEKPLFSLFKQIVMTLSNHYTSRGDLESSVTNFFKTDKKYYSIILDNIKSRIILDNWEYTSVKEKMDKVFI